MLFNDQGWIEDSLQKEACKKMFRKIANISEELMKTLEKLDGMQIEEAHKLTRLRRKSVVGTLQARRLFWWF